jgi:hypothetical protein
MIKNKAVRLVLISAWSASSPISRMKADGPLPGRTWRFWGKCNGGRIRLWRWRVAWVWLTTGFRANERRSRFSAIPSRCSPCPCWPLPAVSGARGAGSVWGRLRAAAHIRSAVCKGGLEVLAPDVSTKGLPGIFCIYLAGAALVAPGFVDLWPFASRRHPSFRAHGYPSFIPCP